MTHLYQIGDKVFFNQGPGFSVKVNDAFTVRAQLPPLGDLFQYRIKSDSEPYERVVSEPQIDRMPSVIRSDGEVLSPTLQLA